MFCRDLAGHDVIPSLQLFTSRNNSRLISSSSSSLTPQLCRFNRSDWNVGQEVCKGAGAGGAPSRGGLIASCYSGTSHEFRPNLSKRYVKSFVSPPRQLMAIALRDCQLHVGRSECYRRGRRRWNGMRRHELTPRFIFFFSTSLLQRARAGPLDPTRYLSAAKQTELFGVITLLHSTILPIGE